MKAVKRKTPIFHPPPPPQRTQTKMQPQPPSSPTTPPDGTIDASTATVPRSPRTLSTPLTTRKMRILLLSSDTGGGHRASAESLRAALLRLYPEQVHIKIVDFWVDLAEGLFVNVPQQYAFLAKNPPLWKFVYEFTRFPPGRAATDCFVNVFGHRKVKHAFETLQPDLIISVHPLVNTLSVKVLQQMEKYSGIPRVPYITVVTDLGGAHPTWFHRRADMTYIPSTGVRRVGEKVGVKPSSMKLLGLPIRQDFWEESGEKHTMKQMLGLRVDTPTVLAIGGGDGVGGLKTVVEALAKVLSRRLRGHVQIVVICGKNQSLKRRIASMTWPCTVLPLGFVDNMSDWMTACDIICTKAGPGTIAEALVRALPIIITSFLPGQEEANVKFVEEHGVGTFANKPTKIAEIAAEWLENPQLLHDKSRKCLLVARPHASLEIAEDIMNVAVGRIKQNLETMKRREAARTALARNHLARYIPDAARIMESSKESHLVFRLKFMLRVLLGGMLAREALARDADS